MKRIATIFAFVLLAVGISLQLYAVNTVHRVARHSHDKTAFYESLIETQEKLIAVLEDPNQRNGSLVGIYKRELQYQEKHNDRDFPSQATLSLLLRCSYAMIVIAGLILIVHRDKGNSLAGVSGQIDFKSRSRQVVFFVCFMYLCWLMMQVMHELGHVLFVVIPGGRVDKVVLHPFSISRTDVAVNPRPLLQVWGGPVMGILLPIVIWGMARLFTTHYLPLLRFFAGFCCIVNGAYIGFGPDSPGLDTQIILSMGCERWLLVTFGISMIALGLWFFNTTGKVFGIGVPQGEVCNRHLIVSICLLIAIVGIELLLVAA